MRKINNDWEYVSEWSEAFFNDGEADEVVRIPHAVSLTPLHNASEQDYQKISGYRKTVRFAKEDKEKRHFLQFDGAAHIATVWFNGRELGTHKNGYTAFRYEITDLVKYDADNVIVVRLDSTENASIPPFGFVIDYLTYGGIYRDVKIDTRPKALISDVFVSTPNLNTAEVVLTTDGTNGDETVTYEIFDAEHNAVCVREALAKDTKINLFAQNVKPWSPDCPKLYTLKVTLKGEEEDVYTTAFGFRTVSWNENNFLLNGEKFFIRGLNRHQSFPYIGYAATDSLQVEDARILKEELKVNAVRTSHYPQSQAFIDACDRLGLLVFTEIPGWQHIGDAEWKKQAVENTKEMILQYRNHPCIYLWGVRINESLDDDVLYGQTNSIAHQLDPTRATSGVRYLEKSSLLEDVYAYNDFSHTGKNPGCKKKKDVTSDMKKPLIISEANGHMFPTKPTDRMERRLEHALRHARVLNDAMGDGEHAGVYQWCMFDYATHKDFGSGDRVCYHGVMDAFRNPKIAGSVYASQCNDEDILEVGSSMDIGDYDGGHLDTTWVFSNADEIRLYKNDDFVKSFYPSNKFSALPHPPFEINDTIGELLTSKEGLQGTQEKLVHDAMLSAQKYGLADMPKRDMLKLGWCMLHYKMKYSYGVELYGKYVGGWGGDSTAWKFEAVKGGRVVKTVIKTPDTKLHLDTSVSSTVLHEGDTYDMCALRMQLKDSNDNLASYVSLPIKIRTEGPVEVIGDDIAVSEGGATGAYFRTTGEAGDAKIILSSAQTEDVTISLKVVKGE